MMGVCFCFEKTSWFNLVKQFWWVFAFVENQNRNLDNIETGGSIKIAIFGLGSFDQPGPSNSKNSHILMC